MKKLIPLLVIPIQLVAQIFIDFNSNDLEQWTGDTNHYQVDSLFQLQLVAPCQSSTSTIFYPSTAILNGNWELWTQHHEQEAILQGICFDNTFVSSQFIGIQSTYTSTRSQKFFYDNLLLVHKNCFCDF